MKRHGWMILLFLLGAPAFGQYQDARLWAGLSVRYDPGKKWKLVLEEEVRIFDRIRRLDKINSELTSSYQINKLMELGVLYRLIANREQVGYFYFNHRFGVNLEFHQQYSRWNLSVKPGFQITFAGFRNTENWYNPENYVRIVSEVSRELKNKKTEPYTNIEFWYRISTGEQGFIDQYRWTIGIKQKLNKRNRLDLYYRLQQELQVKNPLTAHIIGIGYRYMIR